MGTMLYIHTLFHYVQYAQLGMCIDVDVCAYFFCHKILYNLYENLTKSAKNGFYIQIWRFTTTKQRDP